MIEAWLIEIAKGIGKVFLNPLLYWAVLIVFLSGYKRIQRDRINFGTKIDEIFTEWKNTLSPSILFGLFLSLLTLGLGMVFTYETIMLLSIVIIVLSFTFNLSVLSASYTIGITYLLLLFLPFLLTKQTFLKADLFLDTNFTGLTILLGIFLLAEAVLLSRIKRNETFPDLLLGNRGIWIGQHHLKKISIIPFFTLVPTGMIVPFADFWPYFSIDGDTYSLVLVPFLIGFHYKVTGYLPSHIAKKIAQSVMWLGIIVLCLGIGSIYLPWLSFASVIIAIIGKELINYKQRTKDKEKRAYFLETKRGIKILGIIPGTPADRLDILVGETISKVNGKKIDRSAELYQALQESGAFFKLEVLDDNGEKRFVQGAFYEGDHHELGLIFAGPPNRSKKSKHNASIQSEQH
ncbi:PDZ domain-containing protein [Virgibacillus alimentarius]|uniref:PDZ domain-containing protein n=1 Tax=Virgibacillus alimentarius TaxID=698769 RepID=UPI0004931A2A|nr:PDZ domain-containing protein [Virgibacillus alimentarius]